MQDRGSFNAEGIDPYESLAAAIVLEVAAEYRRKSKIKTMGSAEKLRQKEIADLENFFLSEWFQMLTSVDGGAILKQLQREVEGIDNKRIS